MKNYTEILEKTATQMPKVFTSNEFNNRAIKNGFPAIKLKHCGLGSFISKFATNDARFSKTWTKKSVPTSYADFSSIDTMTVEQMVNSLKKKGYKIMKPVQDWIEL